MRYRGQGHEIAVALPPGPPEAASIRARFDAAYAALFGRTIPRLEVEALTWTLALATERPLPAAAAAPAPVPAPAPRGHRPVLDPATGTTEDSALYDRASLAPGMAFPGPALVQEDGTTTVVPRGFTASVNALGQLILEA
jgi:N-methylhydantoinase A